MNAVMWATETGTRPTSKQQRGAAPSAPNGQPTMEGFVEQQRAEGQLDSSGNFQIDLENLATRYRKVLAEPLEAVLFFLQSAQRWEAKKVLASVLREEAVIRIELPPDSEIPELLGPEPAENLNTIFGPAHPLSEFAHGYNILRFGDAMDPRLSWEGERLAIMIPFASRKPFFGKAPIRHKLTGWFNLSHLSKVPIYLDRRAAAGLRPSNSALRKCIRITREDGVPAPMASFETAAVGRYGCLSAGTTDTNLANYGLDFEDWVTPRHFKDFEINGDTYTAGMDPQGLLPQRPVFFARSENSKQPTVDFHCFEFYRRKSGCPVIPLRHGVALEPFTIKQWYGPAIVYLDASNLKTDFSGRRLVEDRHYRKTVEELENHLLHCLKYLRTVEGRYQPRISRKQLLKKSIAWGVGAPVLVGLTLVSGGTLPAFFKSGTVLASVLGGSSGLGFLSQARHIPNPDTYTASMRKTYLGWLSDPELPDIFRTD